MVVVATSVIVVGTTVVVGIMVVVSVATSIATSRNKCKGQRIAICSINIHDCKIQVGLIRGSRRPDNRIRVTEARVVKIRSLTRSYR